MNIEQLRAIYERQQAAGDSIVLPVAATGENMEYILREAFHCRRCAGGCCSRSAVKLDVAEMTVLRQRLQEREDTDPQRYFTYVKPLESWVIRQPCPFFEAGGNEAACTAYSSRPEACAKYPLTGPVVTREGLELLTVHCACPAAWELVEYAYRAAEEAGAEIEAEG